MGRHQTTIGPNYFEDMFQQTHDPWELETSPYEQAKFADSIAALSGRTYAQALEVGCAKGVLTSQLAEWCGALLAIDVSETALAAAQQRLTDAPHVEFERMAFPGDAPDRQFDLVVLSEVAYYWNDPDLKRSASWLKSHMVPGGDILLVHFTGETDYPQTGDGAADMLIELTSPIMGLIASQRREHYRLDILRRTS